MRLRYLLTIDLLVPSTLNCPVLVNSDGHRSQSINNRCNVFVFVSGPKTPSKVYGKKPNNASIAIRFLQHLE